MWFLAWLVDYLSSGVEGTDLTGLIIPNLSVLFISLIMRTAKTLRIDAGKNRFGLCYVLRGEKGDPMFAIRRRSVPGVLAMFVLIMSMAVPAWGGGRPLSTSLSGDQEVPGSGSEATGKAHLTLNQGQGEICVDITSSGYAEGEVILAGHIHAAPAGSNGPVVVNLQVASSDHSICVEAEPELIKDIRQNPSDYYINLHSNLTPSGVIRGQLGK